MNQSHLERIAKLSSMPDGTEFPGASVALSELYGSYGIRAIEKVEQLGLTYSQIWDMYKASGRNKHVMYSNLRAR